MPAVLDVAALAVGLISLILLWAIYVGFRPLLVALAGAVPVIGSTLSTTVDTVITAAYEWTLSTVKANVTLLLGVIMAPVHWAATIIDTIIGLYQDIYTVIAYVRYTVLPREISSALGVVQGWITGAETYATHLYNQAIAYTSTLVTQLYVFTVHGLAAADAYAETLAADSIHYTQSAVTGAEEYAAHLAAGATAYAQNAVTSAEAYSQALYNQAITYTGIQVTDLENWVAGRLTTTDALVAAGFGALATDIDAVKTGTLAYVTDAVGVVETELTTLKTECTDRLCANLGGLADLLAGLSGDLGVAAVLAFAAQAAADPAGTARALDEVVSPIAHGTVSVVRDIIGV